MSSFKDITGKVYGRLTVIERLENDKHNQARWKCLCECGNYTVAVTSELNRGNVRSCGCLSREISKKVNFKHGFKNTRLYKVWDSMKKRCYNPNSQNYKYYGGRGITMCNEWKNDFKSFHDWAFANGYDENAEYMKCTIDPYSQGAPRAGPAGHAQEVGPVCQHPPCGDLRVPDSQVSSEGRDRAWRRLYLHPRTHRWHVLWQEAGTHYQCRWRGGGTGHQLLHPSRGGAHPARGLSVCTPAS